MINTLQRFWRDESGPELVEWAVVTIILLVAAIVLYIAVGKILGNVICSIFCWIDMTRNYDKQQAANKTGSCASEDRECQNRAP